MAEETVKATPPVREIASPEYLKAVADMQEFAKRAESAAERNEKAAQLMADVEKAREKNRVVTTAPTPSRDTTFGSLSELVNSTPESMSNDWEREVHKQFWALKSMDGVYRLGAQQGRISYESPKALKLGQKFDRLLRQKSDNWDTPTDTAGGGAVGSQDWVQVLYASQFVDFYNLPARVAQLFPRVEMPQGSGTVRVPVATTANAVTVVAEVTAATTTYLQATTGPDTDFVQLTAVKHRAGTLMSWEFTEDAVVNAMGYAQSAIRKQLALGLDAAIMNGQTTNLATLDGTNGPGAANGYMTSVPPLVNCSLRYYTHVQNPTFNVPAGAAPFDSGMVAAARKFLGKYGVVPSECVLLCSPNAYLDLVADADQNVITVEKYGNAATILTGELARVYGIPVIPTDQLAANMGTDGDAATTGTSTVALMVNRERWFLGVKRDIEVRVVPNPVADQIGIYGFVRTAFNFAPPITDRIAVEIINIPS